MSESEVAKKPTFAQVRSTKHFSIVELARAAAVNTVVVYKMLLKEPVKRWQAEEVLKALSDMSKCNYSLENVNVALEE